MNVADYVNVLIRSVVHDELPPEKPGEFTFDDVLKFASNHRIENICYAGIIKLKTKPDENILKKWISCVNRNLAQEIVQDNEKKTLADAFNKAQVLYLPMKGWYMRDLYPKKEYRFMSDIDILIHRADREKAYQVMRQLGYSRDHDDIGRVDSYKKGRFLHVELQLDMIEMMYSDWYEYYQEIWEQVYIKKGYECRLDWNDFYIYMCVNFAKDYMMKGTGVRSALDFYLFRQKYGDSLDFDYIGKELVNLNIKDIEKELVRIADRWFGTGVTDDVDAHMSSKLIADGIYGSTNQHISNLYKMMTKGRHSSIVNKIAYIARRAFPELKLMSYKYPVLNKMPFMLPLFWIIRWFKHYKQPIREVKVVMKIK